MAASLPFTTRIWFAWACFFRVLFDGIFAAKVYDPKLLEEGGGGAASGDPVVKEKVVEKIVEKIVEKRVEVRVEVPAKGPPPTDAALQLLALFQREGRFIDFLEEDVASFSDADIGAAARVVHSGCRKALRDHVKLEPVRSEEEGVKVSLPAETTAAQRSEMKLTGNVQGKGPHTGTLRHRGWRATEVKLPTAVAGHDTHIVAQAEVEL